MRPCSIPDAIDRWLEREMFRKNYGKKEGWCLEMDHYEALGFALASLFPVNAR